MNLRNPFRRFSQSKTSSETPTSESMPLEPSALEPSAAPLESASADPSIKVESTSDSLESSEPRSIWDIVAELSDSSPTSSFDDLNEVPFAGDQDQALAADQPPKTVQVSESFQSPPTDLSENTQSSQSLSETDPAIFEEVKTVDSPELRAFRNFFKTDARIKSELIDLAPKETDNYDEQRRMRYVDNAYKEFSRFCRDFEEISADFNFSDLTRRPLHDFFQRGVERLTPKTFESGTPKKLYDSEFSNLRPEFIERVKEECYGGSPFIYGSLSKLLREATSVNEVLHAYHSFILNNNSFYESIPIIAQSQSIEERPISLRGDLSSTSRAIYDSVVADQLDIGDTDIVAAGDHTMIMVRDRGHSTMISVEPDRRTGKFWVEYNIPKLCNINMIKALPGLAGYTENGAKGRFFADCSEIGPKISEFIASVPSDEDMYRPGGTAYREDDLSHYTGVIEPLPPNDVT